MEVPSMGDCCTPLTVVGSGSPAASRMVGATSITWVNCDRSPPGSSMPCGQWTIVPLRVPPQCEATCLVHWNGVHTAPRPADRVVVVGGRRAELVHLAEHEL